ncbi:2Fe-2S iron-sulfur cluster-binding protein [Luedemannella helvata]|uniref:2Fe-2S iron-sulfur cluster-binding protein n=1 Tax=Luedemannella helvata TaxID=349315 RepID=A0ABN2KIM1_9ACTN
MNRRHRSAGRVDRARVLRFVFDGVSYEGYPGDTLASALLANGIHHVSTSVNHGRPRGILTAGSEEPTALVRVSAPYVEPMRTATTVELVDGLVAEPLAGRGRLTGPDRARYDAVWAHCDVLVVGGGPAGLSAAVEAVREGARVILVDERPEPGGSALDLGTAFETRDLIADDLAVLRSSAAATVLSRTTALGLYDDGLVTAIQRLTDHLPAGAGGTRQRLWRVRAGRIQLATGWHERPLAFAGNDVPGVMLASAAVSYLHRYGVLVGRRAVVLTTNDTGHAAAATLGAAGMEIATVVDTRDAYPVIEVFGGTRVRGVAVGERRYDADAVLVAGGFSPVLQLYAQAGGRLRFDGARGAMVPDGHRGPVQYVSPLPPPSHVPALQGGYVDLQRDVTVADVARARDAGLRSVEHVKRYTTAGTAHDQGKTSGFLTALAAGTGLELTTSRPPYVPVLFAALAGRDRGALFDPVRQTAAHDAHVALGAVFENVGQWRRARYYPRDGESMDEAVRRECRSARSSVAVMDASTLGKIELVGPDAGEFLDRLYTNVISTLAVGAIRYGVMCGVDGMVFDDGTVARLADDRFLVTTTTGNAARVLDWMEEWLQTEWPDLRVWCTSVTERWSTIAVVGPHARTLLPATTHSLPFMRWQDAVVAGLPARVCRISFSGELAYEVSVAWSSGAALWDAFVGAGATPYGTETMHVLRAEKGYPIIGQDTDGTVTPHDLGLGWAVSTRKAHFLGKRSLARPDTSRPDRKHLVGVLPDDPSLRLPEGSHLVADGVPVGHVTSSYHSAALGRSFALALLTSGRHRHGERLHATLLDGAGLRTTSVTVTSPVLYDPDNTRRDGDAPEAVVSLPDARPAASPFAAFADRFAAVADRTGGGVRIAEVPLGAQLTVRGPAPMPPNTTIVTATHTALWLGPDETLLVSPAGGDLPRPPDDAWSVVDTSAARVAIAVAGPHARRLLAFGCALDLRPDRFGAGGCAQTHVARTQALLWHRADDEYLLVVRPSFGPYLADWLVDASAGLSTAATIDQPYGQFSPDEHTRMKT